MGIVISINENKLMNVIYEAVSRALKSMDNEVLKEGYLDDTYGSENFRRWFSGSKMVDENGKPLLLGHATRNFGFNRFNTNFIHLSSINDASYFSGGNKRMFKYKKTIDKLSDEEVVDLYNKNIKYKGEEDIYFLDEMSYKMILNKYDERIAECHDEEYIKEMGKFGFSLKKIQEDAKWLVLCKKYLMTKYEKMKGKLYCRPYHKKMPRLTPQNLVKKTIGNWFMIYFPTIKILKNEIIDKMFHDDRYLGKGGTYALCARVLKPLYVNCHGNSWDRIYVRKDCCSDYDGIYDKYSEHYEARLFRGSDIPLDNETIALFAKELGYDGVVFKNIREGAYGNIMMKETYIVFSTKQLKSPFENNGEFGDIENLFK
jgi:hypothetical protein